jgi:hypothetical protein
MYFCDKRSMRPITTAQLRELGRVAHGRPVWGLEGVLLIFDALTQRIVSEDEFRRLQGERAETRRQGYVNGRRKSREKYTASLAVCGS